VHIICSGKQKTKAQMSGFVLARKAVHQNKIPILGL